MRRIGPGALNLIMAIVILGLFGAIFAASLTGNILLVVAIVVAVGLGVVTTIIWGVRHRRPWRVGGAGSAWGGSNGAHHGTYDGYDSGTSCGGGSTGGDSGGGGGGY